jgi:site-specific recombinase XerD
MLEQVYRRPIGWARRRSGPLGPHVDGFVVFEKQLGFARLTLQEDLRIVSALNEWLQKHRQGAVDLNEARLEEFIRYRHRRHPHCHSGRPTLTRLLCYLRESGIIPPAEPEPESNAIERLLAEFADYLTKDRGLVQTTVARCLSMVRRFLVHQFTSQDIHLEALKARDVSCFVVDFARKTSPVRAKDMVSALRAFFRWLRFNGSIELDLSAAVPSVVNRRLCSIPIAIPQKQVRLLLRSCNRGTPLGLRDYAVLLLLARLGLRAGEIAKLRLEDIHWREGEITVPRKPGRSERLPLPCDVGKALVAYIRNGRPSCSERRVFLCMKAPYRGFDYPNAVTYIVNSALRRAGLKPKRRGAHLLRHSLATNLLEKGATLTEIGQLLGHETSDATEIYAKVDFEALRSVAQPWPGGTR